MGMIYGFRLSVTPVVLTFLVGLLFVTVKWKSLLTKKSRFLRPNPRLFLFAKFSQDYFQDFATKYFQDRLQYHQKRGKS